MERVQGKSVGGGGGEVEKGLILSAIRLIKLPEATKLSKALAEQ